MKVHFYKVLVCKLQLTSPSRKKGIIMHCFTYFSNLFQAQMREEVTD